MPLSAPEICGLQILQLSSIYDAVCLKYRRWKTDRKTKYAVKLLKLHQDGVSLSLKEAFFLLSQDLVSRWRSIEESEETYYAHGQFFGVCWHTTTDPLCTPWEISDKGIGLLLGLNVLE